MISWERALIFSRIVETMNGWASMTYLLRDDQMDHTARGKVVDQGAFSKDGLTDDKVDMCFIHLVRLRVKKSGGSELVARPCHMG